MSLADHILAELEAHGTRRCLICSNINPCPDHSWTDQREELARRREDVVTRVGIGAGRAANAPANGHLSLVICHSEVTASIVTNDE